MKALPLALTLAFLSSAPAFAQSAAPAPASEAPQLTPSPDGAQTYIISPVDGARVRGPVTVRFGLKGMGVTQAGSTAKNAGHHHLLVDVTEPVNLSEPIPADKTHLHFGSGQTETTLDLAPGPHTLQLVLGDANHRPFSPNVASAKIHIVVVAPGRPPVARPRIVHPHGHRPQIRSRALRRS